MIADALRDKLISNLPLFSNLAPEEVSELGILMSEISYKAGEIFVEQNAFIDYFYIIISGTAEVRKKVAQEEIVLNTLGAGEPIGLGSKGIFSPGGRRSANVLALTDISLLRIDVASFNDFLKTSSFKHKEMEQITDNILKIDFIKQSYPFIHLSNDEISTISHKFEEINLAKDEVLFKEGASGNNCYLIRNGNILIYTTDDNNVEQQLAIREPGEFLGEAALITSNPRSASARALTETQLLVIDNKVFSDLIRGSQAFAESMMGIMVIRFRPTAVPGIHVRSQTQKDGQTIFMLHNPELHQYYRLSEEGMFIWQQLDGEKTIREITVSFFKKYRKFVPDVICNILYNLAKDGFVNIPSMSSELYNVAESPFKRFLSKIGKLATVEYVYTHTDKMLSTIYNRGVFIFFTWPVQLLLVLITISGLIAFLAHYPSISADIVKVSPTFILLLLLLIPISAIVVVLHESGHAFTAKKLGYSIQRVGIGWLGLGPIAYVDTSELWVAERNHRLLVNIAGVYVDFFMGSLLALLAFFTNSSHIAVYAWLLSLFIYYNGIRNLSPLRDYDGYFMLSDFFDRTKLREAAIKWLTQILPSKKAAWTLKYIPEITYWLYSFTYIFVSIAILFVILETLFKFFGILTILTIPTFYFSLALVSVVFALTLWNVWREIS